MLTRYSAELDREDQEAAASQAAIFEQIRSQGDNLSLPSTLEEDVDSEGVGEETDMNEV